MLNNYTKNKNNELNESGHSKRSGEDGIEKNSIKIRKLKTFK